DQGEVGDDILVVGWGSTYGSISQGVRAARRRGVKVAHAQIRHLSPLPKNLGELLRSFKKILVPELNNGMLVKLLRSEFLVDAQGLNKIAGQPFKVAEIEAAIASHLES
ncbi:MAG: 2-oxoglutarate ferredoxin oxidoreductase subunit alpha, partial [Myxococcales bacterium]|nr:2-oxoglutarate ferredoxin oxidoreductase subunit alpha [Myxococcales bacterium]